MTTRQLSQRKARWYGGWQHGECVQTAEVEMASETISTISRCLHEGVRDKALFTDPETGRWRCVSCGACCLSAGIILGPDFDRGDGGCVHLTEAGRCDRYEDRPIACHAFGPDWLRIECCFSLVRTYGGRVSEMAQSRPGIPHGDTNSTRTV